MLLHKLVEANRAKVGAICALAWTQSIVRRLQARTERDAKRQIIHQNAVWTSRAVLLMHHLHASADGPGSVRDAKSEVGLKIMAGTDFLTLPGHVRMSGPERQQ